MWETHTNNFRTFDRWKSLRSALKHRIANAIYSVCGCVHWLCAKNNCTVQCINQYIVKFNHKIGYVQLQAVLLSTIEKSGVGLFTHSFIHFLLLCSIMCFVCAKTTLRFNGAYNIPFAGVYWFMSFKPMKCFECAFFAILCSHQKLIRYLHTNEVHDMICHIIPRMLFFLGSI